MIAREALTGVVLAGGRARRMQAAGSGPGAGGEEPSPYDRVGAEPQDSDAVPVGPLVEKGLLMLGGRTLAEHASGFLASHVGRVLISANRRPEVYGRYGKVVPDDQSLGRDSGPLAGLASALAETGTPWLVSIPADVINLPDDLVERLAERVNAASCPAAYARGARDQPLCAILHESLAADLRAYLRRGERKVQTWLTNNNAAAVSFKEGSHRFFNINTPGDLLRAQQWFAAGGR